ncbi:MAG: sigma-70 family RNA polymerase sigma factor [Isosphaeraceae bacterium]
MESTRSIPILGGQLGTLYHLGAAGTLTDGQLLDRFLTRNDPAASEAAFAALVDRHGAMVLSVCRNVLGDPHDAHDAFQATFLVLVSKAASIRKRESVGGWLFGIARRVAARARVEGARHRRHLQQLVVERTNCADDRKGSIPSEPEPDFAPLIAEVDRLPERFRAPVVLHYFEGLSTEATAQRLGCARGTVLSRLSRARGRIKERLEQQGVSFTALIPAADGLNRWIPTATVPGGLAQTTIRAASSLSLAGATIESVVPAAVASLSRGVARTLVLSKVRVGAGILLLAVAGVSIGLAATLTPDEPRRANAGPEMASPPRGTVTKSEKPLVDEKAPGNPVVFRGKVTDADGKPVAGAEILLGLNTFTLDEPGSPRRMAASGPDGRFEVAIPPANFELRSDPGMIPFVPVLAARLPGMGPDWIQIDAKKPAGEITLRLRRDDVPIEGRVINLEGRPIPGLTVTIGYIAEFPAGLLKKLGENAGKMNPDLWGEMRNAFIPGRDGPIPPVRTGPDGQFRISGIGRDRVAVILVEGESIEPSLAMVLTSRDPAYKPLHLPGDGSSKQKLEGPRFDLSAAPGRMIVGVVSDFDTRKPISGAKVHSWMLRLVTTDDEGKFLLRGQPKGKENQLDVTVDGGPYIKVAKPVPNPSGIGPIPLDITLKRGVWVEGKVTNRATGRPVKAVVQYYPFRDNPHVKECPDASFLDNNVSDEVEFPTDAEGHFRAVALPGGGLLTVQVREPGYLTAQPLDLKVAGNVLHAANFPYQMHAYQALIPIDVPVGPRLAIPEISLVPGRAQHVQVIGPDGRPVAGANVNSLQQRSVNGETVTSSEFTFIHANPGMLETIVVLQADRSLGATIDLKGDEANPIRLSLQPTGTVSGRLVDEDGRPRSGANLAIMQHFRTRGDWTSAERFDPIATGPDGRFRIKNLVARFPYTVEVIKKGEMNYSFRAEGYLKKNEWNIKPGETQDWGDVQVKSYRP